MLELSTFITIAERSVKARITFYVTPGSRGHCDKYGCPEEPDTPPELQVVSIRDLLQDVEVDLDTISDADMQQIDKTCWEAEHELARRADPPQHLIDQLE